MTSSQILSCRLHNQQITQHQYKKSGELVRWLTAVQAQDYAAAKWAIGLRLPGTIDNDIEQAIADKTIIRTWAMRCTLHFLAPEDVRWIIKLLAPRLATKYAGYLRKLAIDKTVLLKSHKLITQTLQGGKQLTRKEIMTALEKKGIATHDLRANFLLVFAALEGLICLGERRGKQFTYTLLDEWSPSTKKYNRIEALTELANRYFDSHGPATIADFAWWSGLTIADIRIALAEAGSNLKEEIIGGQSYWMSKKMPDIRNKSIDHLLPCYDEYLVGYADRSLAFDKVDDKKMVNGSIFHPSVIINSKIGGTWRRSFKGDKVMIEANLFAPITEKQKKNIITISNQYANFLGMDAEIKIKK